MRCLESFITRLVFKKKRPKEETKTPKNKFEKIDCVLNSEYWDTGDMGYFKKELKGTVKITYDSTEQTHKLDFTFPYEDIHDHKYIYSYMHGIFQPTFIYIKDLDSDEKKDKLINYSERLLHVYGITINGSSGGKFSICSETSINNIFKYLSPHIQITAKG